MAYSAKRNKWTAIMLLTGLLALRTAAMCEASGLASPRPTPSQSQLAAVSCATQAGAQLIRMTNNVLALFKHNCWTLIPEQEEFVGEENGLVKIRVKRDGTIRWTVYRHEQATSAIATSAPVKPVKPIAGFTVQKMYTRVRDLGFRCEGPKARSSSNEPLVWNCQGESTREEGGKLLKFQSYLVDILGDDKGHLLSITIYTFPGKGGLDRNATVRVLSAIASLSYKGAEPQRVSSWLRSGLSSQKQFAHAIEAGGVVFDLIVRDPPVLNIAIKNF